MLLVLPVKVVQFTVHTKYGHIFKNTCENWENSKLCENTLPCGRRVSTQFLVFPISTRVDTTVYQYGKNVLYFFYKIAQRTITEEWRETFRVDIELYEHGS